MQGREAKGLFCVMVTSLLLAVALIVAPAVALGEEQLTENLPDQTVLEGVDTNGVDGQQGMMTDNPAGFDNTNQGVGSDVGEPTGNENGNVGEQTGENGNEGEQTGNETGNVGEQTGNESIGTSEQSEGTGCEDNSPDDGAVGQDMSGSDGVADGEGSADKTDEADDPQQGESAPEGDEPKQGDENDEGDEPKQGDEAPEDGVANGEPTDDSQGDSKDEEADGKQETTQETAPAKGEAAPKTEKATDETEVNQPQAEAAKETAAPEVKPAQTEYVSHTQSTETAAPEGTAATTSAKPATTASAKPATTKVASQKAPASKPAAKVAAVAAPKNAATPKKASVAKTPVKAAKTAAKMAAKKAAQRYFWVRFYDAFGNLLKKQKVARGKKASAPKLATAAGRTFKGWDVKFNKVLKHLYVHPLYKDKSKTYFFGWNYGNADMSPSTWYYRKAGKELRFQRFVGKSNGLSVPLDMKFTGWNTKPDGSGEAYAPGAVVKAPARDLIFYAQWQKMAAKVKVTVKANFRDMTDDIYNVEKGEPLKLGNGATYRDGYVVVGYNTKANGKGKAYTLKQFENLKPTKNLTLYQMWKKANAPLRFVDNHTKGQSETTYVRSGVSYQVKRYADRHRNGYDLVGWNTKANGKGKMYKIYANAELTEQDPAYVKVPAKGVTLYAQWRKRGDGKEHTVVYNSNYGKGEKFTTKYYSGSDFYPGNGFSRKGYTLVSYNTKKNGKGTAFFPEERVSMPNKNFTLYAQWKKANTKVVIHPNYSGNDFYTGKKATKKTMKVVAGYASVVDEWIGRDGYRMMGFNTKKNGSGMSLAGNASLGLTDYYGAPLVTKKNLNLYAQWKKLTAIVVNDNYKGAPKAGKSYYWPGSETTLSSYDSSREGYTLVGYNTKANGKGKSYKLNEYFVVPKKNLTLYAQWRKNTATLKLVDNYKGGSTSTIKVAPGVMLNKANVSFGNGYRDGYEFVGYNTKANGKGTKVDRSVFDSLKVGKKGMTLYGQWTKTPTITYKANNGTSEKKTSHSFSAYLDAPGFTKKGMAAAGWNTKANGKGVSYGIGDDVYNIPTSMTYYVQWKKPTAKITCKWVTDSGATKTKTIGVIGGAYNGYDLTEPADRAKVYFDGWYTKKNGKGEYYYQSNNDIFIPKKGITLWANWTKKPTLTYNANYSGSTATKVTYMRPYQYCDLEESTLFTREDYYIASWNTKKDGSGESFTLPYGYRYMGDENATLYAQWAPKTRFTLDYNGGTNGSASTEVVKKGNPCADPYDYDVNLATYSNKAKRAGYTLIGWSDDKQEPFSYESPGYDYSAGANGTYSWYDGSNETLYAVWAKDYKVTLNANGGTGGTSFVVKYNDGSISLDSKAKPTREGYTFLGWSTSSTSEYADTYSVWYDELPSDVTYYAVWSKNE